MSNDGLRLTELFSGLGFGEEETAQMVDLCRSQGLTGTTVCRHALRHYQLHVSRLLAGERCTYSGDAERTSNFYSSHSSPADISRQSD